MLRTSLFLPDCACQCPLHAFSHSKALWKFISVAELGLCVFITAGPNIIKLCAGGGGGQ
jgi:hypothetical protein